MWSVFNQFVFFLLFYQHFSPSPSLIFQCSPIFWSRSNQINYLWDTTCKNCLNFFFGLWIQWECKFFCMSLGFVTCWILFIFFQLKLGKVLDFGEVVEAKKQRKTGDASLFAFGDGYLSVFGRWIWCKSYIWYIKRKI